MLTCSNAYPADLFSKIGRESVTGMKLLAEEKWLIEDFFKDLDETAKRKQKVARRLLEFAKAASLIGQEARAVLGSDSIGSLAESSFQLLESDLYENR